MINKFLLIKNIKNLFFFNSALFKKKFKKIYIEYFNDLNEKSKLVKTHKNNVFVFFLPKKKIYRKISFLPSGFENIKSEIKGLNWYCDQKKIKSFVKRKYFTKSFEAVDIKNIKGKKFKSWESLSKNFNQLIIAYNHYLKIFKKKKKSFIHGDLTMDNIIFEKKKINLIDWEFFNARKKFWGYDLAYLFLSAISLPYIANKKFSKKDLYLFLQLWKLLIKLKINKKILLNPYEYFERSINNDRVLYKSKKISKKKFFPFITPKSFKKMIIKNIQKII